MGLSDFLGYIASIAATIPVVGPMFVKLTKGKMIADGPEQLNLPKLLKPLSIRKPKAKKIIKSKEKTENLAKLMAEERKSYVATITALAKLKSAGK